MILAEQSFGLRIDAVRGILGRRQLTKVPLAAPEIAGVLNLRGRIVTVFDLGRRLGIERRAALPATRAIDIVVDHRGALYSLLVDRVGDVLLDDEGFEAETSGLPPSWRPLAYGIYRLPKDVIVEFDIERLLDLQPADRDVASRRTSRRQTNLDNGVEAWRTDVRWCWLACARGRRFHRRSGGNAGHPRGHSRNCSDRKCRFGQRGARHPRGACGNAADRRDLPGCGNAGADRDRGAAASPPGITFLTRRDSVVADPARGCGDDGSIRRRRRGPCVQAAGVRGLRPARLCHGACGQGRSSGRRCTARPPGSACRHTASGGTGSRARIGPTIRGGAAVPPQAPMEAWTSAATSSRSAARPVGRKRCCSCSRRCRPPTAADPVTQYMPPALTAMLVERIGRLAGAACHEAQDGEPVTRGRIYVAPGDHHPEVEGDPGRTARVRLSRGAPENVCRPSVDPMLRSLAPLYRSGLCVIILAGMGQDGSAGAHSVRLHGGRILAQDEASSVVRGTPGAIVRQGLADHVLPVTEIATMLRPRACRQHVGVA